MSRNHTALTLTGIVSRNLLRQPLRSTLTIIGVAAGVIAIVTLGAIVAGMRRGVETGIHTAGSDMAIYQAGVASDILSTLEEEPTRKALLADADVRAVTAGLSHIMPIEGQRFTIMIGVETEAYTFEPQKVDGPPIRADDECSLGSIAARQFKKRIGDTLSIGGSEFRVVSTFTTGVVIYDGAVVIKLSALQRMLGREGRVTAFFVDLRDGADPAVVAARLEAANPGIVAVTGASEYRKVDIGLSTLESMVWAVTLAAIVIGSIVVLNTMWMTVLERTREIGLLRAVGWSRGDVIRLVIVESIVVGCFALVVGIGAGVLLAELIARAPIASQIFRPAYTAQPFVLAAVATLVLSIAGAALPAWRAARVSPAEALRYE